jgi:hypothetical protein
LRAVEAAHGAQSQSDAVQMVPGCSHPGGTASDHGASGGDGSEPCSPEPGLPRRGQHADGGLCGGGAGIVGQGCRVGLPSHAGGTPERAGAGRGEDSQGHVRSLRSLRPADFAGPSSRGTRDGSLRPLREPSPGTTQPRRNATAVPLQDQGPNTGLALRWAPVEGRGGFR